MSIGLAVGIAGGYALLLADAPADAPERRACIRCARSAPPASSTARASVLHGSGFLAVFVAGLLVGDARVPYKDEVERFFTSLASLAEIVVFVAFGLTIDLTGISGRAWVDGLVLALVLALVARPLAVGALLLPADLRVGERLFVMWSGLKGAVPIFLAAFADPRRRAGCERDLRHRLRRRRALGRRPGIEHPAGGVARARADARRAAGTARARDEYGRMTWSTPPPPPPVPALVAISVSNRSTPYAGDRRLLTTVSPNADGFRDHALVRFTLTAPALVRMDVVRTDTSGAGKLTTTVIFSKQAPLVRGRNSFQWTPKRNTQPRTYILRLTVTANGRSRVYGAYGPGRCSERAGRARAGNRCGLPRAELRLRGHRARCGSGPTRRR